jgi:hypothetical protein
VISGIIAANDIIGWKKWNYSKNLKNISNVI